MDIDGHRYDEKGHEFDFKPKSTTVTKPSQSTKSTVKNSNNVTPNGAYTSSGFDGGSSHSYTPPPPDPRQYYYPLITGPCAVNNSNYYYTYNELNSNKTIKELALNGGYGSGYYSMLYNSTSINLSKSEKEVAANNVDTTVLHQLATVCIYAKPVLKVLEVCSYVCPAAEPFIIALELISDTLITCAGLDNVKKALTDNGQSGEQRIYELAYGIGEIIYGGTGLLEDLEYINSSNSQNATNDNINVDNSFKKDVFPDDPNDFNPEGLTRRDYDTPNGKVYKWYDSDGVPKYEWDEDFDYGSHYHILDPNEKRLPRFDGDVHFKPGDEIK